MNFKTAIDPKILSLLIKNNVIAYKEQPIRLKSGTNSHFYVSGRSEATRNTGLGLVIGSCIKRVADKISESHHKSSQRCYIGVPTVGTGLAAMAVMAHVVYGKIDEAGFEILREQKKSYGDNGTWLNGKYQEEENYFLLDNVLTTGMSLIEAARKLKEDGFDLKKLHTIVFVDRTVPGAIDGACGESGLTNISSVFNLKNLVEEAVKNKFWPEKAQEAYEKETKYRLRSGGGEGL